MTLSLDLVSQKTDHIAPVLKVVQGPWEGGGPSGDNGPARFVLKPVDKNNKKHRKMNSWD